MADITMTNATNSTSSTNTTPSQNTYLSSSHALRLDPEVKAAFKDRVRKSYHNSFREDYHHKTLRTNIGGVLFKPRYFPKAYIDKRVERLYEAEIGRRQQNEAEIRRLQQIEHDIAEFKRDFERRERSHPLFKPTKPKKEVIDLTTPPPSPKQPKREVIDLTLDSDTDSDTDKRPRPPPKASAKPAASKRVGFFEQFQQTKPNKALR